MKRHNKLLVFIVAAAMIFSGISFNVVTFAANPNQYSIKTTDSTGNDVNNNFYDTKQDVYVRIDGEPFEYYVFVVSPNGTMLGSGGPFDPDIVFNLYDATGFDDTDNPGGSYNVWVGLVNEFDHSKMKNDHFKVKGSEPEDPLGEIDVTKIVIDHDDEVITDDDTQFKFRLYFWDKNKWEEVEDESPFYITGNDTVTIDGLPLGKYKVVEEDIPDGFELDSANDVEVTLDKNNLERKTEFTNKMDDDTPPPPPPGKGKLIVHKRIQRESGSIDANLDDNQFTIRLKGPLPVDGDLYEVRDLTINDDENGDHVTFDDLPFGDYILEETHINGEPIGSNVYHIQMPGNNGAAVGSSVDIDSNGTVNRWLVNHETPPPPPWVGTIRIQKLIREEPNESLEGFEFELWKDGVKVRGPEETDEFGEIDFSGLPAGKYEIRELESDFIAEYLDDNPVEIGPEIENENDDVWVIRVNNRRIEIDDIVVQKIVSNDSVISGFVFRLYRIVEDEEVFVGEMTTGVSGRVVFEDQPDGDYVLYEVARSGYFMGIGVPGSGNGEEFTHSDNMEYPIEVTNRKLPPPPPGKGEIEVEKIVQNRGGNPTSSSTRFYFVLEMLIDDDWDEVDDGSIVGNGSLVFDELEDGKYRVREVRIDSDFRLVSDNNVEVEIEEGSSEDVQFINRIRPPQDDEDEEEEEDEPEDEPEVLEITVVETPVPAAPPVVVVEEVIPLATLPKTGASDATLFSGLGAALMGIGLLIKKRR